jgi:hypothetical protein
VTRRIVLAVLALIAAVLGSVALPLGILTAGQDQRAFTDETVATTTTLANVAEERLDDGTGERALHRLVGRLAGEDMKVSVSDRAQDRRDHSAAGRAASPARHRAEGHRTGRLSPGRRRPGGRSGPQ